MARMYGLRPTVGAQVSLLAAAALLCLASSGSEGERATTGQCPAGEVCSDETPKGLEFDGPGFGDDFLAGPTVKVTAVGGSQTIEVHPIGWFDDIYGFRAEVTSPFTLVSVQDRVVVIRATAAGSSYLRIVDGGTGELYDRLAIEARDCDAVEVAPRSGLLGEPALDPARGDLLYGAASFQWMVRLWSGEHRLVDEGLVITIGSEAGGTVVRDGWDVASVTPAAEATTLEVVATTSAGLSASIRVPLASEIDAILPSEDATVPESAEIGKVITLCFEGHLGEHRVVGLDWSYALETGDGSAVEGGPLFDDACFITIPRTVGEHRLTVTAAQLTRTYAFMVVPAPAPRPPAAPVGATPPPSRGTLGERALGVSPVLPAADEPARSPGSPGVTPGS